MDRIPIAVITAWENAKRDACMKQQRIPIEGQLAEIQHPGKETFAQGITSARTGATHSATVCGIVRCLALPA